MNTSTKHEPGTRGVSICHYCGSTNTVVNSIMSIRDGSHGYIEVAANIICDNCGQSFTVFV